MAVRRDNMKIFQKVHCRAYLKKYSDGVALRCSVVDKRGCFEMPADGNSWKNPIKVKAKELFPNKDIDFIQTPSIINPEKGVE